MNRNSFINRKRPAIEDQVEEWLGPASQLDELITGNPLPAVGEAGTKDEEDQGWKSPVKPG